MINIKSDGTPYGTKVTNNDGLEIADVSSIELKITPNSPQIVAKIEVLVGELDIKNVEGEIVSYVAPFRENI